MSETYVFTGTFAIAAESEAYARDGLMELLAEIVRDDDSLPFDLVLDEEAALIAAAPQMKAALNALVVNYAQTGRVTDEFVQQVARMMEGLD